MPNLLELGMKDKRRPLDFQKLSKVQALIADGAATDGEKAAALAAAGRIRAKWKPAGASGQGPGGPDTSPAYWLGRAFGRVRSGRVGVTEPADSNMLYALGRAWRGLMPKR